MKKALTLLRDLRKPARLLQVVAALALAGCAADPNSYLRDLKRQGVSGSSVVSGETTAKRQIMGTRIPLGESSFYSLSTPNSSSCAGDARRFFPHPASIGASSFSDSSVDLAETLRPSFIKNLSLDLTDSSIDSILNPAIACSVLPNANPNPTKCATFDRTPAQSAGLDLGGGLLLLGGSQGAGLTPDPSGTLRSLSLKTSSTTTPSSTFVDLALDELLTRGSGLQPPARTSASAVLMPSTGQVLMFGGDSVQGPLADTWIFGTSTRSWTFKSTVVTPRTHLMTDLSGGYPGILLPKSALGRANFGYLPTTLLPSSLAPDSTLEKLLIVGGLGVTASGTIGPMLDTYAFNPTFGPEEVTLSTGLVSGELSKWVESFHTRRISTTQDHTQFGLDSYLKPPGVIQQSAISVATSPALSTFTAPGHPYAVSDKIRFDQFRTPVSPMSLPGPTMSIDSGEAKSVASVTPTTFTLTGVSVTDQGTLTNKLLISPSDIAGPLQGGLMQASGKIFWLGGFPWNGDAHGKPKGAYTRFAPQLELDLDGQALAAPNPHWVKPASLPNDLYAFGAATLLPAIDTRSIWLHFGGTTCKDYLWDSSLTGCGFNDRILDLSMDSITNQLIVVSAAPALPTNPTRAGMAAAFGFAPGVPPSSATPVIVVFGGLSQPGVALSSGEAGKLYFVELDNDGDVQNVHTDTPSTTPPALVNAQMVYSHITRKFYLFGGIVPGNNSTTYGDTWELTVGYDANGTGSPFTGTWRKLTPTCYPACPGVRRSHRMAEVSYQTTGNATAASPQSYAIFMEGGTANGLSVYSDRWIFDPTAGPTAAGPNGHWLRVDDFPPRRLAAMASYEVTLSSGLKQRRALLFGGETGLQDPLWHVEGSATPASARYYLPPTLGDTQIFDLADSKWNRAELLGRGYNGSPPSGSDLVSRQAFDATLSARTLTPPPLSGASLVTRTVAGRPPELYLVGGRKKDGSYNPLTTAIWKFCPQSSGPDSSSSGANPACDPTVLDAYSGSWLQLATDETALTEPLQLGSGSFAGASVIDTDRDRLVVFGGITPAGHNPTKKLTEATYSATDSNRVLELDLTTLQWKSLGACTASLPEPRFGHALSYDSVNRRIVLSGGMAITDLGNTSATPLNDLWVGEANAAGTCYTWNLASLPASGAQPPFVSPSPGVAGAAAVGLPADGYGTGAYLLQDQTCVGSGPIVSNDPGVNKLYSGGVSIDLDRSELGSNEDLLLQLSYVPLKEGMKLPSGASATSEDEPVLQVHLISTGLDRDALRRSYQPRSLEFFDTTRFPHVVHQLKVLKAANGQINGQFNEEQVLIPLSSYSTADRIRIERVSGSALLLDVTLQRLGPR